MNIRSIEFEKEIGPETGSLTQPQLSQGIGMSKCFQVAGYFVFLLIFFDRGLQFRIGQLMVSLLTGARVSSSCFDLRDIHDFF